MEIPRVRLKFAKKLRALRKVKELSQEAVAEKAGIDYRYYQKIESQKPGAVRIDTIEKLSKALGVKMRELMDF